MRSGNKGLTNQDESDDESDLDHKVNEVVQSVDTPKTLSRQTSAEEAQGPLVELDDSLDIPWSSLRPTMQAILWLSDLVARYQLRPDVVPGDNPRLHKAMATMELREMDSHLQRAKQTPMELTVILMLHYFDSLAACRKVGSTMPTWSADLTSYQAISRNGR